LSPRRAAGREDRGEQADDDRRDREDDQLPDGEREDDEVDARGEECPEHEPERGSRSHLRARAVITLSFRIMLRMFRRVIRRRGGIPISRVRSNTVKHERVDDSEQADHDREREQDEEHVEDRVEPSDLVVDELFLSSAPSRRGTAFSCRTIAASFAGVSPPRMRMNE